MYLYNTVLYCTVLYCIYYTITTTSYVCFFIIISGHVHVGMYTGAIGILDGYGMRGYLLDLAAQGYDIKTVGHSLGAGKRVRKSVEKGL